MITMIQQSAAHSHVDEISKPSPSPAGKPSPAGTYVLVVDDEQSFREFLARALEAAGYVVKQASGAAAALEMMFTDPAALVLSEIRLPGEDGLWLIERLRAHWPQTAIMMTTAVDDMGTMRRCRDLGAVGYLTKPIKAEHLTAEVQRAMAPGDTATGPQFAVIPDEPTLEMPEESKVDADYTLESPAKCPACGERIERLQAIRLIRGHVNFTSTLPRRGRVLACPHCLAIISAELTNF